jgi:hypothetical protein
MTQPARDGLDRAAALTALVTETLRAARDRGPEMAREARGHG